MSVDLEAVKSHLGWTDRMTRIHGGVGKGDAKKSHEHIAALIRDVERLRVALVKERAAFGHFVGCAWTVKQHNTDDWMYSFAAKLEAAEKQTAAEIEK